MGMDRVTEELVKVDHKPAAALFPCVESWRLERPTGHVDLLIGIQMAEIHPILEKESEHKVGNLRVLTSQFGEGYLLDGAHQSIKPHGEDICNAVLDITRGKLEVEGIPKADFKKQPAISNFCSSKLTFLEAEELGGGQPRRCGTWRNCN